MKRRRDLRKTYAALMLAAALTGAVTPAHTAIELVEVEAALSFAPEPARAGEMLQIRIAESYAQPGVQLRVTDGADVELARMHVGRFGIPVHQIRVPQHARELNVALFDGERPLLQWPAIRVVQPEMEDDTTASQRCGPAADVARDRAMLDAWLQRCRLDHAQLRELELVGIDLAGRILRRADLRGANLSDSSFDGANLQGATLSGARLDGASFNGADLQQADLSHASLFVTDFRNASLQEADFRGAELGSPDFSNANLYRARFDLAAVTDADFTGAICPDGSPPPADCRNHLELQ